MRIKRVASTLALMTTAAFSQQVCDLTFTACPSQLPKTPIAVPMDVISLDARIPYCQETGIISGKENASIVFIIDNSGSMGGTDPDLARFKVVVNLLDAIYAKAPQTRVGLAIFSNRLFFDTRDNPYFKPVFPGDHTQHDAYVPLTRLDTSFADGGPKGVDTLKAFLATRFGDLVHATRQPDERLPDDRAGTDITLGFEAAKEAMKSSPSVKELRFFVFLSDGEAAQVDNIRQPRINEWQQGLATPTTFTVYFDPAGSPNPPQSIQTMTTNIQGNNYSTANPKSAHYAINQPGTQLQNLLEQSVLPFIISVPTTGKGVKLTLTGTPELSTTTKDGTTHFLLNSRVPLQAGTTAIRFDYAHTFKDTTVFPPMPRDSTFTYNLTVQRTPDAVLPPNAIKTCRDQASLALFSGGQSISSITSGQVNLEARLTPSPGEPCPNCTVQLSLTRTPDKETLTLAPLGGFLSGPFTRLESVTPLPGDGKLQHLGADSIVLTWTNPLNPLDVVRKSYPYQSVPSTLELFAGGVPITAITANHGPLEARLTRPTGGTCAGCVVLVSPSAGADRESIPLAPQGGTFNGAFVRLESINPVPGDGILQHGPTDSLVLVWINPENPEDKIRKSYPYTPTLPTLALYGGGKLLTDTITAAYGQLEIRLTLPSGEPCQACKVQVFLTQSPDKEDVVMAGGAVPYRGTFARAVDTTPTPYSGTLEHPAKDSIVILYQNPLSPTQTVRQSYLYVHFTNIASLQVENSLAKTQPNQILESPWTITGAPGVAVVLQPNSSPCCRVLPAQGSDSIHTVGFAVEASRGFALDLRIYSNLAQVVNVVRFTVPGTEFTRLTPIPGKDTRFLRLHWNGLTQEGTRAATGAYVIKTSINLLPLPGITEATAPATSFHRVGVLRQ